MTNYAKVKQAFLNLEIGARFTRTELMELAGVPMDLHTRRTTSGFLSDMMKYDFIVRGGQKNRRAVYKKLSNPRGVSNA